MRPSESALSVERVGESAQIWPGLRLQRCEGCGEGINLSDQLSPEALPAEWWRELGRVRRTTGIPLPTFTLRQPFGFRTFNWPLLNAQGEVRMFMLPQK